MIVEGGPIDEPARREGEVTTAAHLLDAAFANAKEARGLADIDEPVADGHNREFRISEVIYRPLVRRATAALLGANSRLLRTSIQAGSYGWRTGALTTCPRILESDPEE